MPQANGNGVENGDDVEMGDDAAGAPTITDPNVDKIMTVVVPPVKGLKDVVQGDVAMEGTTEGDSSAKTVQGLLVSSFSVLFLCPLSLSSFCICTF